MTVETIAFNRMVDRLSELGVKTRFSGGKMRVLGICHDASDVGAVTFERGRNGGLVVFCHACGGNERFLDAIGWKPSDLYDEPLPERTRDVQGGSNDWIVCTPKGHQKIAEYRYEDEHGDLVHAATRCDHKCFAQWRPDPTAKSGRRWKLNDDQGNRLVRLVPYRLPQILSAIAMEQVIWIAEGEKDVHALVDRGLQATCNAAGAGKWATEHARHLQGADVTVVADRDEPGRRHAELVVDTLRGVARSVYVVQARHGKDAFDHFAGGGTSGDFINVWAPMPYPGDKAGVNA